MGADAMPLATRPCRVLVTAYGREDVLREAEDTGFDGILVKPVSPSVLFDTAMRALGDLDADGTSAGEPVSRK